MIRRWFKIRQLSRYQNRHWDEAGYINHMYTLLGIVREFRAGLDAELNAEMSREIQGER